MTQLLVTYLISLIFVSIDPRVRWFFHFYVFAIIFYSALLYSTTKVYFGGEEAPPLLSALLDAFVGHNRRPTGNYKKN